MSQSITHDHDGIDIAVNINIAQKHGIDILKLSLSSYDSISHNALRNSKLSLH